MKNLLRYLQRFYLFFLINRLQCKGRRKSSGNKTEKGKEKIEVTDLSGRKVIFDKVPESFATLSMGDMNIIHALGGKIVGRPDAKITLPEDIKKVQVIGNAHQPNFEQIASLKPDVLIANNGFQKNVPTVEGQGTKVMISSTNSVQDILKNIELYGTIMKKKIKQKNLTKNYESNEDI